MGSGEKLCKVPVSSFASHRDWLRFKELQVAVYFLLELGPFRRSVGVFPVLRFLVHKLLNW